MGTRRFGFGVFALAAIGVVFLPYFHLHRRAAIIRSSVSNAKPAINRANLSSGTPVISRPMIPSSLSPGRNGSLMLAIVTFVAEINTSDTNYAVLACMLADSINVHRGAWQINKGMHIDLVMLLTDTPENRRVSTFFTDHGYLINWVHSIAPRLGAISGVYKDQFTKFWAFNLTKYSKVLYIDADSIFFQDPSTLFFNLQHFTGCQANGNQGWEGSPSCLNGALLFFQPSEQLFLQHMNQKEILRSKCIFSWMDQTEMGPLNIQNPDWKKPSPQVLEAGLCFDPYAYTMKRSPIYRNFDLQNHMILVHGMKYHNLQQLSTWKWFESLEMQNYVLRPFRVGYEKKERLWHAFNRK
jgi:hypothetical protein